MKPSKYLWKIHRKASIRFITIKKSAEDALNFNWPNLDMDRLISYATIESLNTWRNFARTYFLSCTLHPRREGGSQITLNNIVIRTYDNALDAAMRRCKPWIYQRGNWSEKDEPAWHYPTTFMNCCNEIGCSNQNDISNAFSIPTHVFEHLPLFRNFYAHRSFYTAITAKNVAQRYSIPTYKHPTSILCTPAHGRPQALLLDWIDDIKIIIELLCI